MCPKKSVRSWRVHVLCRTLRKGGGPYLLVLLCDWPGWSAYNCWVASRTWTVCQGGWVFNMLDLLTFQLSTQVLWVCNYQDGPFLDSACRNAKMFSTSLGSKTRATYAFVGPIVVFSPLVGTNTDEWYGGRSCCLIVDLKILHLWQCFTHEFVI